MSDSDDSYVPRYDPNREVLKSFAVEYSSSDESELSPENKDLQSGLTTHYLIEKDQAEIFDIISSGLEQQNIPIFPSTVREHLTQRHGHILTRLKELPGRTKSAVLAGGSLLSVTDGASKEKPAPESVLFDICVISPREPVLILTIISGDKKKEKAMDYNTRLTRRIVQAVKKKTRYNFSAVYGVVEDALCQTRDKFVKKVNQLERDAHVMSISPELVMTHNKCVDIIKPILQLMAADSPHNQAQAKTKDVSGYTRGESSFDMSALVKRIEQLEQDSKSKEQKYEHLSEEMMKMKQDYLIDTRLSLLMRPRSSSVSDSSVSGYGSTEVDSDFPPKQEDEAADRRIFHQEGKDMDTSKIQPGLTTEAIRTGDLELVQYNRDITLHQACEEGKLDVVQYILTQGVADINCRGKEDRTPVMVAARDGQITVFDFLVSQECDLSAVDVDNENVLHLACEGGNTDIVKKLIDNEKFDIESRGFVGRTPVMAAAGKGHKGVFDFLVSKGCNLTAVDEQKNTILHVACLGGHVDMVKYILSQNNVSIESRGLVGRTPVMAAAEEGHKGVFDFLVSKGCNLTAVDEEKNTILHVACIGGHVDMVKYILSQNIVSIESRGLVGRTPVMIAAEKGHKGVFDFLVSKGCSLTAVDEQKNTILHVACIGGHVDMVKYILSQNIFSIESRGLVGRTPVMAAAGNGDKGVFDFLVSKGCSLTAVDGEKNTILHVACLGGHVDMVKHILSQNIVSIECRGFVGRTPVMTAAEKGHKGVFDFLVSKGCNLTAVDETKNTLLHVACIGGNVDMVKYLMTLRVVNVMERMKNKYGQTPVQLAEIKGRGAVARLLNDWR